MRTIKKVLLILLLALPLAAAADYLFKTLDAHDGLTSSQVNCITEDGRGYMWFGTPAGLYRFDGYTFKNFQSDSQDGSSLNDSYIISLQEMLDGNLLVETTSGYCIYHHQTETFERDMKQTFARMGIETIPSVVYIDRHKNVWGAILIKVWSATTNSNSCSSSLVIPTTHMVYLKEWSAPSASAAMVPSSSMRTDAWYAAM